MNLKQHVLVCVLGLSPQIITETLYSLMIQKNPSIPISKIFVITTAIGKKRICKTILNSQQGAFNRFCTEYSIDYKKIEFTERSIMVLSDENAIPLSDIRTVSDNIHASNQILSYIKELASHNDVTIHASIAGGRKTMGIYLAFALQLFGRKDDKLYHVLVDTESESNPDFFFPKKNDNSCVQLADVPFLRLKRYFHTTNNIFDYATVVSNVQSSLEMTQHPHNLTINLYQRTLTINATVIALPPKLFVLYELFARLRAKRENISSPNDLSWYIDLVSLTSEQNIRSMLKSYSRYYSSQSPHYHKLFISGLEAGFSITTIRSDICKINRLIKHKIESMQSSFYLLNATEKSYGSTRYGIPPSPMRIEFKEQ